MTKEATVGVPKRLDLASLGSTLEGHRRRFGVQSWLNHGVRRKRHGEQSYVKWKKGAEAQRRKGIDHDRAPMGHADPEAGLLVQVLLGGPDHLPEVVTEEQVPMTSATRLALPSPRVYRGFRGHTPNSNAEVEYRRLDGPRRYTTLSCQTKHSTTDCVA